MLKTFAICLCLFYLQHLHAQQLLSATDAVKIALENNYSIRIEENNQQVNALNYNIALQAVFPTVNATGSDVQEFNSLNQQYSNGSETKESGVGSNNLTLGIEATLPLFNGFKLYATKNRLQALLQAGENNLNAEIQNTIAAVQLQYYRIVSGQDYIDALQRSLEVAQKKLEIAKMRKALGLVSNAEVYLAEIDVHNNELAMQQQQVIVQQYMAQLNSSMLFPADSVYSIEDTIISDAALQYATLKSAITNNASYVAYNYSVNAAKWAQKEANALRLPNLNLTGGYNFFQNKSEAGFFLVNQNFGPYAGITLNIPIYNAGLYKGQVELAKLNTQNIMLQQQSLLNDLQAALYQAWLSYTGSLQQMETAKLNVDLAQKNLTLELERYRLNEATILELNEVQQNFTDINLGFIQLEFTVKAAEIELKRLAGIIQ